VNGLFLLFWEEGRRNRDIIRVDQGNMTNESNPSLFSNIL
jgi:hypothetical protein